MKKSAEHTKRFPPRAGSLALLGAIFSIALAPLLLPAEASADGRIGGPSEFPAVALPGGLWAPQGIAVSASEGGALYTSDDFIGRVSEFEAGGAFDRAFGWGVVPGAATGTGDLQAGSPQVTNVTTTFGSFNTGFFGVGKILSGPGIPPGDEIEHVSGSGITLAEPAEQNGTGVALSVAVGPGNVPVNDVQELTVPASGGEFNLTFRSPDPGHTTETTTPLAVNATESKPSPAEVQTALSALPNIGPGNVSVSGGPADAAGSHPYLIEFKGRYADTNVRRLQVTESSLSGGAPSAEATVVKRTEGAGVLETCTTECMIASSEEGSGESGNDVGFGTQPGRFNHSKAIAIDNDPSSSSYGDVYVVDQRNFRVEKYDREGHFLLMFGGQVNKTKVEEGKPAAEQDLCTAGELEAGDVCGAGVPGSGPSEFAKGWDQQGNNSLAVGPDGTVYVGDRGRIEEFEPSGAFSGAVTLPLGGGEEPTFVNALAVDSNGDIYAHSETSTCCRVPGVREFGPGPAHALLRTLAPELEEETHLAIDGAGDLFLSEHQGPEGSELFFRAFKPNGALYAEFSSDQVVPFPLARVGQANIYGLAFGDAAEKLYATTSYTTGSAGEEHHFAYIAEIEPPRPGAPRVSNLDVKDLQPKTATLNAVVNPEQFDTTYQFQWISQKDYEADGNSFGAGTESAPSTPEDLGSVSRQDKVETAVSGLEVGTTYRWRVVAQNSEGEAKPEATFETLPAMSIRRFTTRLVGPEEVVLEGEGANNNSLNAGHWQVCLGAEAGIEPSDYSLGCKEGQLAGGSSVFEAIEATFTHLQPNTVYHYKLFAENENTELGHPQESADQTFETELSASEEREVEDCPANGTVHGELKSTLREENHSTALPDCRAYEQVSPVDKNGYGVSNGLLSNGGSTGNQLSPSGERARFPSTGAFAGTTEMASSNGNEYIAHRTPAGWRTEPTLSFFAGPNALSLMWEFNAELSSWLMRSFPKPQAGSSPTEPAEMTLYQHRSDGSVASASTPLRSAEGVSREGYFLDPVAQSGDLSRLFIGANYPLLEGDPRPFQQNENDRIYEVSGAGGPSPSLRLVAEVPPVLHGNFCNLSERSPANVWASEDGSTFIYTQPLPINLSAVSCDLNPYAVFARIAGGAPIQLSAQSPTQCSSGHPCFNAAAASASFDGVSPDGKLAWFTTTQPLINSDTDKTADLYLARLEGGQLTELVQASAGEANSDHPTPGQGAGFQGLVKLSPDGSHIAFVASGVLTANPDPATGESAAPGSANLYVYDANSEELKFVARLDAGPSNLWTPQTKGRRAQFTPDGRYLLFEGNGQLTADDTDSVKDVYRYDFQTGQLIRLSFGRRGNDANGNDDAFPAQLPPVDLPSEQMPNGIAEDASRAISADGSTAIFETPAPLVSRDTNEGKEPNCNPGHTGCDVYEWEEDGHGTCTEVGGCVSLVSDGTYIQGANEAVISASGRDISFHTGAGLAPADVDGAPDIYDARSGGGFPLTAPPPACKSAENCHGTPSGEGLAINPASETNQSGGNGAQVLHCAKGKHKVKRGSEVRCVPNHRRKHRKHHKHGHRRSARRNQGGRK